jgi:hypothetical protein
MITQKLKLHVIASVAACATVFYLGCGDDDSGNPTPSNNGGSSGASSKGGAAGSTAQGGKGGSGGATSTGGTSAGGKGEGGAGNVTSTAGAGAGGQPEGGSAGQPQGGTAGQEGGNGGGGGGGVGDAALPDCADLNTDKCYENCTPTTSEQLLNHCSDARTGCTPFDNSLLTKLGPGGALPTPIP